MRWHWWNLDTITLWLVSTAAQHPESFCVSLHFKHIVAFLKFGVSSLSDSILFKSSKGAELTSICSQVISSNLRFFFERLKQHFISFLIMLISLHPFASAAFSMILWILKWVPKSGCIHVYFLEAEKAGLPEGPLGLELDRCSSNSQLQPLAAMWVWASHSSFLCHFLTSNMKFVFCTTVVSVQVLGTFDSENRSVGITSKIFF